jgi:hypothetical protein
MPHLERPNFMRDTADTFKDNVVWMITVDPMT